VRVSWNFGSNFPGFHRLKKRVFRRTSVEYLTNLRSGSQIFANVISHTSRQVSLEPFVTGMSVVHMTVRISVVDDFEVSLTAMYDRVDTQKKKYRKSVTQTKTQTQTHTDTQCVGCCSTI